MGRVPCCNKEGMKRGAWTAIEDKLLVECIKLHGEGKWSDVPKKAGLKRCGKSCRLRWMNYLRPDIKRGNMSPEEEDLIIRLHKLLGNRWSLIAGRIPGRTDNEIKNYWNTNFAKKTPTRQISNSEKNPITITSAPPSESPPPNPPQFTDLSAAPPPPELEFMALPPPMELQFITDNVNSSDIMMDLDLGEISVSDMLNADDDFIIFHDFKSSDSRNIGSDCRSETSALFGQRENELSGDWTAASDCLDQARHQYFMSSDFSPLAFLFDSEAWVGADDSNVDYPA